MTTAQIFKNKYLQLFLGVLTLILSAQITFELPAPGMNIPITGQTLGVILVAYFSNKYWGSLAVFIYLLLGFAGLPVLADGAGGMEKFVGGSAGFLYGFLIAAIAISKLSADATQRNFWFAFLINIIGTIIILILGNAWLIYKFGWADGLNYGLFPFWKGAIIKIFLGVLIILIYQNVLMKTNIKA